MKWLKRMFYKEKVSKVSSLVEMTEFELSASHKILTRTDNLVKDLLEQIDKQQQTIEQKENEIKRLKAQVRLCSMNVDIKKMTKRSQ